MDRRSFLTRLAIAITALAGGVATFPDEAEAGRPARRARKRRRRRVRRRRRRRHRRRVVRRTWHGRHRWVVPVALAIGWELQHEDRVVVVHEIRVIEVEGESTEVAVTADGEEIPIERADDDTNKVAQEGSYLPDEDQTTAGVETDEEYEVEVDGEDE